MDELCADIEKRLDGASKQFAIFDFDNTVIENDVGETTLGYLCRNNLLKDMSLLGEGGPVDTYHERVFRTYHELERSGKIMEAYTFCVRAFSGFTPEEALGAVRTAIKEEKEEIREENLYGMRLLRGIRTRPQTLALMRFLKEHGVAIWIVSASAEIAVKTAMDHFGIDADLIGVRLRTEDGTYTTELETPTPIMKGKVECMRTYIDPAHDPLLVIDDSTTGLPILETATIKVAVSRENELTDMARDRGWAVI